MPTLRSRMSQRHLLAGLLLLLTAMLWLSPPASTYGQQASEESVAQQETAKQPAAKSRPRGEKLNMFKIIWHSKFWMLPIAAMSIITVAVTVERLVSLRRSRVIPEQLVVELGRLGNTDTGFDPRAAFRICQRFPSAAATVVQSMLLRVGRPHGEVERAVQEASQREAQRLYANVRWLNLAAGVGPLLGLIGTIWGLIVSFHQTTQLLPGQDRANFLAEGIYLALVCTMGGLAVAIPATVMAHYFEGRIINLFFHVDDLALSLLPQLEKYEGRVRFRENDDGNDANRESVTAQRGAPQRV